MIKKLPNTQSVLFIDPPRHDVDIFLSSLESVLTVVSRIKTECTFAGDFNIDLLKADAHLGSESFINSLYSHSFIPFITRPTRFRTSSSTLIDNIFTNKPQNLLISGF